MKFEISHLCVLPLLVSQAIAVLDIPLTLVPGSGPTGTPQAIPTPITGNVTKKANAPTFEQFSSAINPYQLKSPGEAMGVKKRVYKAYIEELPAWMGLQEQAQLFAHIVYLTKGLKVLRNVTCEDSDRTYDYFCGRGYIPIRMRSEYLKVSKVLFKDDRLCRFPMMLDNGENPLYLHTVTLCIKDKKK